MLKAEPIPAFQDNHIWAIHDGHSAAIVDLGEGRARGAVSWPSAGWHWALL